MKRLTVENTKKAVTKVTAPLKDIEKKVNPLEQKVNTNETADSGTEGLKLANQTIQTAEKSIKTAKSAVGTTGKAVKTTVKATSKAIKATAETANKVVKTANKAVKTTKKAVKTTKSAVKTTKSAVKTAGKAVKNSKTVKNATKNIVRVAQKVVRVTSQVITEVATALSNPYVLIPIVIIIVLVVLIFGFVILFGGGDTNEKAMTQAVGLVNVEEQYENGKEYYNNALEARKQELQDIMDSLTFYPEKGEQRHSDLLYYKRFEPSEIIFEKDFPTNTRKQEIMNTWEHQFDDSEIDDFLAIAYVYLEKQKNDEKNTKQKIYKVKFTEELFKELIEKCIKYSDTILEGQECPGQNCDFDQDKYNSMNEAEEKKNAAVAGFNGWNDYILPLIQEGNIADAEGEIANWVYVYGDIFTEEPRYSNYDEAYEYYASYCYNEIYMSLLAEYEAKKTEYENSSKCYLEHTLHSLGVSFLNADQLMDELGFEEIDRQWVELTSYGFKNMGAENET